MSFLLVNGIIFLIIILLLILLSWVWPPDSPWAPWWRVNKKIAKLACGLAKINSKDVVYELGSGDGTFLITAAGEFGAKGVGIEIDPLRYSFSKIRFKMNGLSKNVVIIRKNFFDINISKASTVFVYLVPRVLRKLKPKFLKELKSGALIISYKYKIDLPLEKHDKENDIYLYRIGR